MSLASYLQHLSRRFRREPLAQLLLDALDRLGIAIRPFLLFEERSPADVASPAAPELNGAEVRLLRPADMKEVASVPWRGFDEAFFLQRLDRGSGCLGLYAGGRLAAFSWFDLQECNFEGWRFPLHEGEAYLFDAFTLAPWRGKGAAPYLRHRLYQVLADRGCLRYYSVSIRTNRAAIRFKEKLGGRVVGSGWRVTLFGRWRFGSRPPQRAP